MFFRKNLAIPTNKKYVVKKFLSVKRNSTTLTDRVPCKENDAKWDKPTRDMVNVWLGEVVGEQI